VKSFYGTQKQYYQAHFGPGFELIAHGDHINAVIC